MLLEDGLVYFDRRSEKKFLPSSKRDGKEGLMVKEIAKQETVAGTVSQRSDAVTAALEREEPFVFDDAAVGFRNAEASRLKPSIEKEIAYASVCSRKYRALVKDLEIVLAEMLDTGDERIHAIASWLPVRDNIVFDLGISSDASLAAGCPSAVADAVRVAYERDKDAQAHPYITNSGDAVPVTFLSHYLLGLENALPTVLRIAGDNRYELHRKQLTRHTKRFFNSYDVAGKAVAVTQLTDEDAAARSFDSFFAPVASALACMQTMYDLLVHTSVRVNAAKFEKRLSGTIGEILSWKMDAPGPHTVRNPAELDEIVRITPLPKTIRERFLPLVQAFRRCELLLIEYRRKRQVLFREQERLAHMYAKTGTSLAGAIKEMNDRRHALKRRELDAIAAKIDPYLLLTKPGISRSDFNAYLLITVSAARRAGYEPVKSISLLSAGGHGITADTVGEISPMVSVFLSNVRSFPSFIAAMDAVEEKILARAEGSEDVKREVTIQEILTHILVPKTTWVKDAIAFIEKLPDDPAAAIREIASHFVIDAVLSTDGLAPAEKAKMDKARDELFAAVPDAVPTIEGMLQTVIEHATFDDDTLKRVQHALFVNVHGIRIAERLLKRYRLSPSAFRGDIISGLKSIAAEWTGATPEGGADHFYRSINDSHFEELRTALENFNQGEAYQELRKAWQALSIEHKKETEEIAEKLMAEHKLTTLAEQQAYLDERNRIEMEKRDALYAKFMQAEDTAADNPAASMLSYDGLLRQIRRYVRPQLFWTKEIFDLFLIRKYSADEMANINALSFSAYTYYVNRIRFCHRFEEKDIPDPDAIKHVWSENPCAYIAPKHDVPDLDDIFKAGRGKTLRRETVPVHTPASVKAVLEMAEIIYPALFRLRRGARLQYHDTLRKHDQMPLTVLIAPPGVRAMRELPFRPRIFAGVRGRCFGNIARPAFEARDWRLDADYLYTGAVYDPRYNTIIVNADADDTNLFYYILAPDHFTGSRIFSSILMALGMFVFHRLPEYYRSGEHGDNSRSWRSCLLQSRAHERQFYLDHMKDGERTGASQTSGLTYNVPLPEMPMTHYVMELEFASYFSEIMLERLSDHVRNRSRPQVVDAYFARNCDLASLRIVTTDRSSTDARSGYRSQYEAARKSLCGYLGIQYNP